MHGPGRCRWQALLLAGVLGATTAATSGHAEGPLRGVVRDLQLAVRVRSTLAEDADLAPLKLGVSVKNGIATIWGPVSNLDLAPLVKQRIEAITGILEVRTDLYLLPPSREIAKLVIAVPPSEPERRESAFPDNSNPGPTETLSGKTVPLPEPRPEPTSIPVSAHDISHAPPLLAPSPSPRAESMRLTARPLSASTLTDSVERARRADTRYRRLRAEVVGGEVTILAAPVDEALAMELARSISRLSGVTRVIFKTLDDGGW